MDTGTTSLPTLILCAGTAGGIAETCTIPTETAKVRLQLQTTQKYTGVFNAIKVIAKEEGVSQLWRGVTAGVHRHFGCAGFRLGMYAPIRDFWTPEGHVGPTPFHTKCMAAFTSGFIAMWLISPADVVKTRIQGDANSAVPRYPSPTRAYGTIIREEGFTALWTGIGPNSARNATMNIFEVGCYDQAKQTLIQNGLSPDHVSTHIASAFIAAFSACLAACPFDVIKNRWIASQGQYSSASDVVITTLRQEGFFAFYKGFTPFFMRASSFICAQFVAYEQIIKFINRD